MSVTILGRVFYTKIPTLNALHKNGKPYKVSPSPSKGVLLAIADSADDFGENSYNAIDTLALKSSLKRRSVPRVIRALEQNGYCTYTGLSIHGTSIYSINLDKLGYPPKRRSRVGRPKTSDSSNQTSDSSNKTSDSESPDPLINHPLTINDDDAEKISERTSILVRLYESNIGPITSLMADILRNAVIDYPHVEWYEPAFVIAVGNNARKWSYVDAVLDGWKKNGFGWRPDYDKKANANGKGHKKSAKPAGGPSGPPAQVSDADRKLAERIRQERGD